MLNLPHQGLFIIRSIRRRFARVRKNTAQNSRPNTASRILSSSMSWLYIVEKFSVQELSYKAFFHIKHRFLCFKEFKLLRWRMVYFKGIGWKVDFVGNCFAKSTTFFRYYPQFHYHTHLLGVKDDSYYYFETPVR